MSWEYLFLAAVAILVILMVIFRKNPLVKLYWKYALILAPLVLLVIIKIIIDIKNKKTGTGGGTAPGTPDPVMTKIDDLKDDLTLAQQTAAIQIAAAKAKNNEMLKKLEEVQKIPDKKEQIKQLAAMIG